MVNHVNYQYNEGPVSTRSFAYFTYQPRYQVHIHYLVVVRVLIYTIPYTTKTICLE